MEHRTQPNTGPTYSSSQKYCYHSQPAATMMHHNQYQQQQDRTSLISILSCQHGRLRREQRDIEKRDLQKALKYGKRHKCWGKRWMIEYDGIVFITDQSSTREITAYPAPLAFAPIHGKATQDHNKARLLLEKKPQLSSSHTVLVIDNSGSMLTHDIPLHRDRQTAAYTETALEFVAEQLFRGTANNRDLVSLVEFSSSAKVIFSREPISWVLYNKLLARRDSRLYKEREVAKSLDAEVWHGDSNYLPALQLAKQLLETGNHEDCALSLLFLSDGAPSDSAQLNLSPPKTRYLICQCITDIAIQFGEKLNMTMIGFGNAYGDFHTLYAMAEAVKIAPGGATAEFVYCDKMAQSIGEAVTSFATSLTRTRLSLTNASRRRKYTRRCIQAERWTRTWSEWQYFRILNHYVFSPRKRGVLQYSGFPDGAITEENRAESIEMERNPPMLLAMRTVPCGEGVERVAFNCQLAFESNPSSFVLGPMVAKETNCEERIGENIHFHRSFLEAKSLAILLAKEFNQRICALPDYNAQKTPKLSFLPCSILLLEDPAWPGGTRDVLVEKRLDVHKFQWTKWNNNAGVVNGSAPLMPLDVDHELAKLEANSGDMMLSEIIEGDEESDDDDDEEDSDDEDQDDDDDGFDSFDDDDGSLMDDESMEESYDSFSDLVDPSDYLQAFTHFTYLYTNKKVMVCDLQGIFNTDMVPPTFELSDPAIHYASKRRREVFGLTDKGRKGMQLFFKTHKCTDICKMMQLSAKNKQWRKHWQGAEIYA